MKAQQHLPFEPLTLPTAAFNFSDIAQPQFDRLDIGKGLSLARWSVNESTNESADEKDVLYHRQDVHTLSLYISGGTHSYRKDKPDCKGGPGKLCLMPRDSQSKWAMRDNIDFAHLYMTQEAINWFFVSTFDSDIRDGTLPELLYTSDKILAAKLAQSLRTAESSMTESCIVDPSLILEQTVTDVLYHLFRSKLLKKPAATARNSGLSPCHRKRVKEYIAAHYMNKITINDMAALTQLSDFHFAKMFKCSFGISPAAFVNLVRIDKIKTMLKTSANTSLADISAATGFAQQSHMTQAFKNQTGNTPLQYRKMLC